MSLSICRRVSAYPGLFSSAQLFNHGHVTLIDDAGTVHVVRLFPSCISASVSLFLCFCLRLCRALSASLACALFIMFACMSVSISVCSSACVCLLVFQSVRLPVYDLLSFTVLAQSRCCLTRSPYSPTEAAVIAFLQRPSIPLADPVGQSGLLLLNDRQ